MGTDLKTCAGYVALTIGALIGVSSSSAHALTCGTNQLQVPRAGQSNVPTDTLLWGFSSGDLQLVGPSGEIVSLVERALVVRWSSYDRGGIPVFVPTSTLQPETRYSIEHTTGESDWQFRYEFVTGTGPASSAPELPVLVSSEPGVGTFWGSLTPARWLDLQFEGIHERGLILIGTAGGVEDGGTTAVASVEDLLIDGPASAAAAAAVPPLDWVSDTGQLSAGLGDCSILPDGAPDALSAR